MGVEETVRGLGCMAKGLGCLLVIGIIWGGFHLLCGLITIGIVNLFFVAEKFYWDHQGVILSTIGVVVVLVIANAIGKNSE